MCARARVACDSGLHVVCVSQVAGKGAKAPGAAKPAAAGKGKAAAPVVKARGYVKRYPRLTKKVASGIKEAQSKQRALAVAKLIAQVRLHVELCVFVCVLLCWGSGRWQRQCCAVLLRRCT